MSKTLTVPEALKALANGEKITSSWVMYSEKYAHLVKDVVVYSNSSVACIESLLGADNLRIYEEPKKMIKVAKYAYFIKDTWCESENFHKDDCDFQEDYSYVKTFKRLDYTEIEVEDY